MQENLGNKPRSMIKTFSFKMDDGFKETIIGDGYFSQGYYYYDLIPDLTGYSLSDAQSWASKRGITLKYNYVKRAGAAEGSIVDQEYPEKKRVDRIPNKTMTLDIVKNNEDKPDCLVTPTNSACKLPNLVGKKKDSFYTWANKFSNNIDGYFKFDEEETEDEDKVGTVYKQSQPAGTTVKELLADKEKKLIITVYVAKEENTQGGDNTGGDNTGGDNTGGDNTGGDNTGGDNTGGDNTGGDNTGGDNTGGDNTGGDNTGGDNTGGDNTGGDSTNP
jgi:hypothetical protein